jgi:putative hydrolase of HD superfamily
MPDATTQPRLPSIRKGLLQLVFNGSYMKRWNDKLRPMELLEVDKQAHKMTVAWVLTWLNSRDMPEAERLALSEEVVEGGLFDYLYRLVITDIKPPIFYQIKANPDHYRRLSEWVYEQLLPRVQVLGPEFTHKLHSYLLRPEPVSKAERILEAAHIFASRYEFHLIKGLNPSDEDLVETEAELERSLAAHADLAGVDELLAGQASELGRFAQLCGQLRFQTRWSQTPRIPETSVLGHMFIVAAYAYFFSLETGACRAMTVNNFFTGLFHDLPELLTRDIISPVKRSVSGIGDLIREYEQRELERRVYALLEEDGRGLADRLRYYLGSGIESEFCNSVIIDGKVRVVEWEELRSLHNVDEHDPRDGGLIKICDNLAAFIEAYTALRNGITADQLQQSLWRIRQKYQKSPYEFGVHIGALLADFD